MGFSLELLFTHLCKQPAFFDANIEVYSSENTDFTKRMISELRYYTSGSAANTDRDIADTLWFWYATPDAELQAEPSDGLCVVSAGNAEERDYIRQHFACCIFLPSKTLIMDAFNQLLEYYDLLVDWENKMDIFIARKADISEVVAAGEAIIQNPIVIWDNQFNILAHPSYSLSDMPTLQSWVAKKRVPGNAVEAFITGGYLKNYKDYRKTQVCWPVSSDCPCTLRVFFEGNRQRLVMVHYYSKVNPSCAQSELIAILESKVERYISEVMADGNASRSNLYELFLLDVIAHKMSEEEIKDKLKYLKTPYNAKSKLYTLKMESYNKPTASYIKYTIRTIFPHVFAAEANGMVYALSWNEQEDEDAQKNYRESLERLLEVTDSRCAVSNSMDNIRQAYLAAKQCETALKIGALSHPEERCVSYREVYFYDLIINYCLKMDCKIEEGICEGLKRLIENDAKTGNDNMRLLDIYLNKDRNITFTAKDMFLHRNSVIYRLSRIEELMGLSLDDAQVRQELIASFKFFELWQIEKKRGIKLLEQITQ